MKCFEINNQVTQFWYAMLWTFNINLYFVTYWNIKNYVIINILYQIEI